MITKSSVGDYHRDRRLDMEKYKASYKEKWRLTFFGVQDVFIHKMCQYFNEDLNNGKKKVFIKLCSHGGQCPFFQGVVGFE